MVLSERKQRKIFEMFKAGDSTRKIKKTVNSALSTVQEYKKIFDAIKAGKLLSVSSSKTYHSSRIQSIKDLGYDLQGVQPYENPTNDKPSTTDIPAQNQHLLQQLLEDLRQSENENKELEQKLKQVSDERDDSR